MEEFIVDVLTEFLEVVFHYLTYLSNIYPNEIFEDRKKYGAIVKYSLHPTLNKYITECLKTIKELIQNECLDRVVYCLTDDRGCEVKKFVISIIDDLKCSEKFIDNKDYYLIKLEQDLRAFCLKLIHSKMFDCDLSEGSSFKILLYTNESAFVKLSKNPEFEHFQFIEYGRKDNLEEKEYFIHPLHMINVNNISIQIYGEQQDDL